MKVLIKVTKEILIKTANCALYWVQAKDATGMHCAITHAVREIFPFCSTGQEYIYVCDSFEKLIDENNCNYVNIILPDIAIEFIREFDKASPIDRIHMETISFEIDIPQELIERIGISQIYKILSESKTLEHVN